MRNISDVIESFLKQVIELSETGEIEVQRSMLAEKFQCVPSQINYVISTRFSHDKGFLVESKRGGGGYIRIKKLELGSKNAFYQALLSVIGDELPQAAAIEILERLRETDFIEDTEYNLIRAIIVREVLNIPLPLRDIVRANILKVSLRVVFSQ